MNKVYSLKLKQLKISQMNLLEEKQQMVQKLKVLIEREREYQLSSQLLQSASIEARKVNSGSTGNQLREQSRWSKRALILKGYSEDKVSNLRKEIDSINGQVEKCSLEVEKQKRNMSNLKGKIRAGIKGIKLAIELGDLEEDIIKYSY